MLESRRVLVRTRSTNGAGIRSQNTSQIHVFGAILNKVERWYNVYLGVRDSGACCEEAVRGPGCLRGYRARALQADVRGPAHGTDVVRVLAPRPADAPCNVQTQAHESPHVQLMRPAMYRRKLMVREQNTSQIQILASF